MLSSGKSLPSFISLNLTTGECSISTTDNSLAGNYSILVKAALNDASNTSDISMDILLNVIKFNSPPYFLTNFED